ncbi:MAG: hypothetical protein KGL53_14705 [Elusimicrobia bacterium]|nr:hypothetical protein [Elusimicrobiota bacterium]
MTRALRSLLLASAAVLAAAGAARAAQVQVVKDGKVWGTLDSYDVGPDVYLGLKEAGSLYGAQLYWYPVQGQVALTIRGRTVAFHEDTATVSVDGRGVTMPRPLLMRVGQAFAPVEFFADPAFAEVSGLRTRFDPRTRVLQVDARADVGPMRWFSYPDHTRFVLELKPGLRYQTGRREAGGFEVTVPNGVIDQVQDAAVEDGVVDRAQLTQDASQARLSLAFEKGAGRVRVMELEDPRRLVLDVMRRPGAPEGAEPAGATLPPNPHSLDASRQTPTARQITPARR